jgi:glycosyltransferase involved in cell wall biosynthesis
LHISKVLDSIVNHPLVQEIIVVDDGSTDSTKEIIVKYPKVKLISYGANKGKSFALATGIENTTNNILMLIDADLKNLTPENVTDLALPVISKNVDVSISLRKNSLAIYRLIGLDFVSGERVFHKSLIADYLEEIKNLPRFGCEVFVNKVIINKKLRIKVVNWSNVYCVRKSEKVGAWRGFIGEIKMIKQILRVTGLFQIINQNLKMLSLSCMQ